MQQKERDDSGRVSLHGNSEIFPKQAGRNLKYVTMIMLSLENKLP